MDEKKLTESPPSRYYSYNPLTGVDNYEEEVIDAEVVEAETKRTPPIRNMVINISPLTAFIIVAGTLGLAVVFSKLLEGAFLIFILLILLGLIKDSR